MPDPPRTASFKPLLGRTAKAVLLSLFSPAGPCKSEPGYGAIAAQIMRTRSFHFGANVLLFRALTNQLDPSNAGSK